MISSKVALDTNLLVLLIIGSVAEEEIGKHRRVRAFTTEDFALLLTIIEGKDIVFTPNVLTELSNLSRQGFNKDRARQITDKIAMLAARQQEIYVPSKNATSAKEFQWIGLADTAWLEIDDHETMILTTDAMLYNAALRRNILAANFNNLRLSRSL